MQKTAFIWKDRRLKNTVKLVVAVIFFAFAIQAQEKLPVIKSNTYIVSIQNGTELRKDSWRFALEAKPDVYKADLINGKTTKVTFISVVVLSYKQPLLRQMK